MFDENDDGYWDGITKMALIAVVAQSPDRQQSVSQQPPWAEV